MAHRGRREEAGLPAEEALLFVWGKARMPRGCVMLKQGLWRRSKQLETSRRSPKRFRARSLIVLLATVAIPSSLMTGTARADVSILIYGPSLGQEQAVAEALGYSVTVADEATWSSMTTEQFASYSAIVFGDPFCGSDLSILDTANANKATWSAAVTGGIEVIGTDPSYHYGVGQSAQLMRRGLRWTGHGTGTGLFVELSCYYFTAVHGTPVDFLSEVGSFTVQGQGTLCDSVEVTSKGVSHPALRDITDAGLSGWGCSIHEVFDSYPSDTFSPLAGAADVDVPYILATRARP
jgi:hypothetical protein